MTSSGTTLALAALALIESLILELRERELLGEAELSGLLDDAADAHARAAEEAGAAAYHRDVCEVINTLRGGGNSVQVIKRIVESGTH